jgi:hypothetical protein
MGWRIMLQPRAWPRRWPFSPDPGQVSHGFLENHGEKMRKDEEQWFNNERR